MRLSLLQRLSLSAALLCLPLFCFFQAKLLLHASHHFTNPHVVVVTSEGFRQRLLQREPTTSKTRPVLRFDWTSLEPLSPLARRMAAHQNNCSLPVGNFWFRNRFGLGSDIHVWSQAICNSISVNHRLSTNLPWIWRDDTQCGTMRSLMMQPNQASAMTCYFPHAEPACENNHQFPPMNVSRGHGRVRHECQDTLAAYNVSIPELRAAATEFLFTQVSPLVQNEAQRQCEIIFGSASRPPPDLITVHIRWGDKADEMKLVPIEAYIDAVKELQKLRGRELPPNIFLATEDPRAVYEFVRAAPANWSIHVDAYFREMLPYRPKEDLYNGSPRLAHDLLGRPGLLALGSLLVAMESNDYVLTTASNWSRLMDELRKNVIDPRCGSCTRMIDLKPGEW